MRLAEGLEIADGRYCLQRRLGAGGMASVWLGRDVRLGRLVAIKVIADTLADDESWLVRFKREARAAAALSHPNIVQLFDYGVEDGRPYLVMEHIPGANLSELLADGAAPRPDPGVLARELLEAVAHVHAAGIVHRDIKPANILLDAQGRSHLTDFGIANSDGATALTQTGMVIGTLSYLAPEVAAGQPARPSSDLYSAGMVIREVAGAAPSPEIAALVGALTAGDAGVRVPSAAAALELLAAASPTAATRAIARPPAPTAVQPDAQPRPSAGDGGARDPVGPARPRARRVAALVAGLLAVLAIVLLVTLAGGEDPPSGGLRPSSPAAGPAPAGAPLSEQLRALDAIVDRAAGR
jgi:serine/threonine-protein kinase